MSADFEDIMRRVRAAESATRILRKFSSWEAASDAETKFPNRDRFAARFKRAHLVTILAEFNLPPARIDNLIRRSIAAVDDLVLSDCSTKTRNNFKTQISKLIDHLSTLSDVWDGVDANLKNALEYHLDGTLGLSPDPSPIQILKNCDRTERMFAVFDSDLRYLATELKTIHDALDMDRSRSPFEYACAYHIACAWYENIGQFPTTSANDSSGAYETPFQKFIIEAISPRRPIGGAVVAAARTCVREERGSSLGT
jgi:hypothetical protein